MVIVDVGPDDACPYTVSYNGRTVFKGLVDAAEAVPLVPGRQVLGLGVRPRRARLAPHDRVLGRR